MSTSGACWCSTSRGRDWTQRHGPSSTRTWEEQPLEARPVIYTDHSGAAALSATHSIALGPPDGARPPSPDAEAVPAAARIELVRSNDRAAVTVDDPELAARLADGWRIDRAEPLR